MNPVPHPPYLPDLAPTEFFFVGWLVGWLVGWFPGTKKVLRGKHFANVQELKQKMGEALKYITINEFKNCLDSGKMF